MFYRISLRICLGVCRLHLRQILFFISRRTHRYLIIFYSYDTEQTTAKNSILRPKRVLYHLNVHQLEIKGRCFKCCIHELLNRIEAHIKHVRSLQKRTDFKQTSPSFLWLCTHTCHPPRKGAHTPTRLRDKLVRGSPLALLTLAARCRIFIGYFLAPVDRWMRYTSPLVVALRRYVLY